MTVYPFDIGISDGGPQVSSLASLPALYSAAGYIRPKYWRIMAAWNYVSKAKSPGTARMDTVNNVPSTTKRDWTTIDRCINDILLIPNCKPLMVIGQGRPAWSGGGNGNIFAYFFNLFGLFVSQATATDYGNFVTEVVTRYKPGGVGIRTDGIYAPNAGKGVTCYEIWNEENSPLWGQKVSAASYVQYLKAAYNAVKAQLPGTQSTVVFGGLQHVERAGPWAGNGIINLPEIDFLTQCYTREPLLNNYFDVLGEHVYTQSDQHSYAPNGSVAGPAPNILNDNYIQLQALRALLVAKGASAKPMWITECGIETYGGTTEDEQLTWLTANFDLLATFAYIDTVLLYNLRDSGAGNILDQNMWGLIRADGTPKSSYTWATTLQGTIYNGDVQQSVACTAAFGAVRSIAANLQQSCTLTAAMVANLQRTIAAQQNIGFTASVDANKVMFPAHAQALALAPLFDASLIRAGTDVTITELDVALTADFGPHLVASTQANQTLAMTASAAAQWTQFVAAAQTLALTTAAAATVGIASSHAQTLTLTASMAAQLAEVLAVTQTVTFTSAMLASRSQSTDAQQTATFTPAANGTIPPKLVVFFGTSGSFSTASPGTGTISGWTPQTNDLVVWFANVSSGSAAINTILSGWVNAFGGTTLLASGGNNAVVLYHQVTSTEATAATTAWTFTNLFAGSESGRRLCVVIRGANVTTPIGAGNGSATSSNSITIPQYTVTHEGSVTLGFSGADAVTTNETVGAPSSPWVNVGGTYANGAVTPTAMCFMNNTPNAVVGALSPAGTQTITRTDSYCACAFELVPA